MINVFQHFLSGKCSEESHDFDSPWDVQALLLLEENFPLPTTPILGTNELEIPRQWK